VSDEAALRKAIDAWNTGGVDAFMEHVTADVEWHPPPGFLEGELFRGRDAVGAALGDQFGAVFTSGRLKVLEVIEAPNGWFIAAHHSVEGQASGMDLAWPVFLLLEFDGELISGIWAFLEREQAERQAGIDA
jgi:hypothetical protein